ncbi:MAG TPA: hypothetical protein VND64_35950 [Pirellulales bacterium]|nr:hypothetical protein [Pirellulales bacterium]
MQPKPVGAQLTYVAQHGHEIIYPVLPDEEFEAAVSISPAPFDR